MFYRLFFIILGLVIAITLAYAQNVTSLVVATCGSPPAGMYVAGHSGPLTLNTSGQICGS